MMPFAITSASPAGDVNLIPYSAAHSAWAVARVYTLPHRTHTTTYTTTQPSALATLPLAHGSNNAAPGLAWWTSPQQMLHHSCCLLPPASVHITNILQAGGLRAGAARHGMFCWFYGLLSARYRAGSVTRSLRGLNQAPCHIQHLLPAGGARSRTHQPGCR